MSTVGERLKSAMDRAGKNPRDVEDAIRAEAKRQRLAGYSYGSIYGCVRGEQSLSTPVLDLIADELGVSRIWLRQGRGPRSAAEAQILRPDPAEARVELDDYFLQGAPELLAIEHAGLGHVLAQLVARIIAERDLEPTDGENIRAVAAEVQEAVLAALEPGRKPIEATDVLGVLLTLENALDRR